MKNMAQLRHSKHLKECLKNCGKNGITIIMKKRGKMWKNVIHRNTWQNQRPLVSKEGAAKGVAHALKGCCLSCSLSFKLPNIEQILL